MHANISKNRVRQVHYDTSNHIVLRHNTTRQWCQFFGQFSKFLEEFYRIYIYCTLAWADTDFQFPESKLRLPSSPILFKMAAGSSLGPLLKGVELKEKKDYYNYKPNKL